MKRSEMIKLIKDHMVEHQFYERTKAAEMLLDELEKEGMLPPYFISRVNGYECRLLDWEPEDA